MSSQQTVNVLPILERLIPEQRAAACHNGPEHLAISAYAGTGKTSTLVGRVAYLLACGTEPSSIAILTFSKRAAQECKDRVARYMGDMAKGVWAGTWHAFSHLWLMRCQKMLNLEGWRVIDEDDCETIVRAIRGRLLGDEKAKFPTAEEVVKQISYFRNAGRFATFGDYLREFTSYSQEERDFLEKAYDEFDAKRLELMVLNYDDVVQQFLTGLTTNEEFRDLVKGSYSNLCLDEQQDANPMLAALAENMRDPAKLFCIGDPRQAIYSFRGADSKLFLSFPQRIQPTKTFELNVNFRSYQEVLNVADWILEQDETRYGGTGIAHRGSGGRKPELYEFQNSFQEAEWIVDELVAHKKSGGKYHDVMVLVRGRNDGVIVEAELAKRSIAYQYIGGASLFAARHVKEVLSTVQASLVPSDELAWVRALSVYDGVGDTTAHKMFSAGCTKPSSLDAVLALDAQFPKYKHALTGISTAIRAGTQPAAVIKATVEALKPVLSTKKAYQKNIKNRLRDLDLLVKLAERHDDLQKFLTAYLLDPVTASEVNEQEDFTRICSVHSSKGLESPIVFLPQLQRGKYPSMRALQQGPDAVAEERRVLYCAVTRAMDRLVMSRLVENADPQAPYVDPRTPYFLENLPAELVA
jgi:DNA helicase-2/ATP-dependent DNA helicase PcrA